MEDKNSKEVDNMTPQQYYEELNRFAIENNYKSKEDMRDGLLNRVTDYFVSISDNQEGLSDEELKFSIKSVLSRLQKDTNNISDSGSYDPVFANGIVRGMYTESLPTSRARIRRLLEKPEANEKEIRMSAEFIRGNILQFDRAEQYFASLFSFKYYLFPKRAPEEMGGFSKSKKKVYSLLQSLRLREQYPRVLIDVIQNGVGYYLFKKGSNFVDLIRIPPDMCRITNVRTSMGICFEVDLYYFYYLYKTGCLAPELVAEYKDLIDDFSAPLDKDKGTRRERSKNRRIYLPISPVYGFCFVADAYKPTAVPLLSALLPDSLDILEYKSLQKQKAILETWCIIPQIIPYDSAEKPKVPLQLAKQVIQNLQQVLPAGVVTFSTPLETQAPITLQHANNQSNIVGLGEQNFFSAVGIAGNVMGVGEAKSKGIVEFSNMVDAGFVHHMYKQFETCTNLLIMLFVNEKDWKVSFFGNPYQHKEEVELAERTFATTNMPAEYLGANLGFEPHDFEYLILMGDQNKLKEKMSPIVSSYNTSGEAILDSKNSGKEKSSVEISDSGEQTREAETNAN